MEKEKISIHFHQKGGVMDTDDKVLIKNSEAEVTSKYNGQSVKQLAREELEDLVSKAHSLSQKTIAITSEEFPPSDSTSYDIKITDGTEEINFHPRGGILLKY